MAGEVVRAAARLTGVPAIPGGIRGRAAEPLAASSSARIPFSVRPAAATVSSGEEGADELMPRVVFHGAPTLEEAREATSELIVGLENIYPSSHYESGSSLSNSQVEPAEASSVSSEITMEPPVPTTTVYTAFRLLRESPVAQNAVASIVTDPNVWNAVRQNAQLQEFLHSERRRWASASHSITGAERLNMLPAQSIEYSSNDSESRRGFSFEDLLVIIKDMVYLMKKSSDLLKNLFGRASAESTANGDHGAPGASAESTANGDHGAPGASAESSANGEHGARGVSAEHVIEASLLGLAIMVIMLIFLKRG